MRRPIDRRRVFRLEMNSAALVTISGRNAMTDAPAVVVDLSATGMRLHMWAEPAKHKLATVRVDCAGDVHSVRARVVRVDPAEEGGFFVGTEFDPMSLEDNPFPTCALVEPVRVKSKSELRAR